MKRPFTIIILGLLLTGLFIFSACGSLENAPAQATTVAETVVAGASTIQAAGNTIKTILTPIDTPSPAPTIDLKTVCVQPLEMTSVLTELTVPNGKKLTAANGWISLFGTDGTMLASKQVPEGRGSMYLNYDVSILTYRCKDGDTVYYDPTSIMVKLP